MKGKSQSQVERSKEIRRIILVTLYSEGIRTTEQLRVAICDTKEVLYNHLTFLTHAGLIESNHPPKLNIMKRWRLTKKSPATD